MPFKKQIISLMTPLWHLQVRRLPADELHALTVDPEEDGGPVDVAQCLLQPHPSAWSTSSCGLSVLGHNKFNLISKSFALTPHEWTVTGTSIIYTDPSVSSCSGAALQPLRQRLDPCLQYQNWGRWPALIGKEQERGRGGSNWLNLTHMKNKGE